MQLNELESNVQRLRLEGPAVCSSSTNEVSVGEQPVSSTAAPANTVEPASPHEVVKSTAEEDGPVDDDVMPAAVTPVVSDADDVAGNPDSITTTDAASPAQKSKCTRCG